MALRDTNPEEIDRLMREVQSEWEQKDAEEHVQETWTLFLQVYQLIGMVSLDIEASKGHLNQEALRNRTASIANAQVEDHIASQALSLSAKISPMLDKLEAQQQIIARENWGDDQTPTGKMSGTVVTLINLIRPIAEVIQDAAADNKVGTMDRLHTTVPREQTQTEP